MATTLNCGLTKADLELLNDTLEASSSELQAEYSKCLMVKDMPEPPEDHVIYDSIIKYKETHKVKERELAAEIKQRKEKIVVLQAKLISIKNELKENESFVNESGKISSADLDFLIFSVKNWEHERLMDYAICVLMKGIITPDFPTHNEGFMGVLQTIQMTYGSEMEASIKEMIEKRRERAVILSAKLLTLKEDMAIEQLFATV